MMVYIYRYFHPQLVLQTIGSVLQSKLETQGELEPEPGIFLPGSGKESSVERSSVTVSIICNMEHSLIRTIYPVLVWVTQVFRRRNDTILKLDI